MGQKWVHNLFFQKQVFLARFEPALMEFSPFHHMYAPLCALRTYLRAVW